MVGATLLVHHDVFAGLGESITSLARRNSEAYVLMLLPAYWDLFCGAADPTGERERAGVGGPVAIAGQVFWFTALLIAVAVLQTGLVGQLRDEIPQSVVTLGESFVAIFGITLYLGWSRAIISRDRSVIDGRPTVPGSTRLLYYLVVLIAAISAEQSWMIGNLPVDVGTWFQINTEAYAAMLLIPLYFDLIAGSGRRWVRVVWYSGLPATPLVVQLAIHFGLAPGSLWAWLETTTEAFIATFVVSAYFDVLRGTWNHSGRSAGSDGGARGAEERIEPGERGRSEPGGHLEGI